MTDSAVVLVTGRYPYGVGEEFVTAELPYLKEVFSRVIVVPLLKSESSTRALPEDVELLDWDYSSARSMIPALVTEATKAAVVESTRRIWKSVPYTGAWTASAMRQAISIERALVRALPPHTPTVFYGYWLSRNAAVAAQISRRWKGPSVAVARAHGGDVFEERASSGFLPGRCYLANRLARVFSVSQAGADRLTNYLFDPAQVTVSRLGVTPSDVRTPKAVEEPWVITSCSNAATVKRLDLIAASIAELVRRGRRVHWKHIGDTALGDFSLQKVIDRYEIGSNVTLIGRVDLAEVRPTIGRENSHVFLNVSSSEGVPVSIMEALSVGLPVVATAVGGTAELVRNNREGILLACDPQAEDVANGIEAVLTQSPGDYECMKQRALERWQEVASAEKNYRGFSSELKALINI